MERRPEALGAAVTYAAEMLPDLPLLVTENGIATADDEDRIRFTGDALRGLPAAIAGGADVRGYVHWSLLDNFEWMLGYRPSAWCRSTGRPSSGRRSRAWPGSARCPAATG
jgi:beta-glucosidase